MNRGSRSNRRGEPLHEAHACRACVAQTAAQFRAWVPSLPLKSNKECATFLLQPTKRSGDANQMSAVDAQPHCAPVLVGVHNGEYTTDRLIDRNAPSNAFPAPINRSRRHSSV